MIARLAVALVSVTLAGSALAASQQDWDQCQGNPPPNPVIHKVANTTLEIYFQNTFTYLECHTKAAIASDPATNSMASDYSFLFGRAGSLSHRDPDLRQGN